MSTASSHLGKGIVVSAGELAAIGQHAAKQNLGARQLSKTFLSGQYASHFRGRGMDYLETRPYTNGDDIRNIDWRVTARTGKTHSKVYIEERDRPIMLVADFSSSMYFGTRNAFKSVAAAKIASVLAFSGVKRGDRIGCLIKTPTGDFDLRPKGGRNHTMQVLQAFSKATHAVETHTENTNSLLDDVLQQAHRSVPTGATVILLSDFYPATNEFHKSLFRLAQRTDIVGFHLFDPMEQTLPLGRSVPLSNGHKRLRVFTDKASREDQQSHFNTHSDELRTLFEKLGQTLIHASTEQDIHSIFKGRQVIKPPRNTRAATPARQGQ
ncbi:MAG: hypothetical protein ACI9J2_000568 [Saprospiraceae bacterium]